MCGISFPQGEVLIFDPWPFKPAGRFCFSVFFVSLGTGEFFSYVSLLFFDAFPTGPLRFLSATLVRPDAKINHIPDRSTRESLFAICSLGDFTPRGKSTTTDCDWLGSRLE